MRHTIQRGIAVAAILLLAACGPADVDQAARQAASAAPELQASAEAALTDPSVQAAISDAAALTSDAASAIGDAAQALQDVLPEELRLQQDQPLVLDTTQQVAGVTNYKWTVTEVPAGAESVKGKVIDENSNGKLTVEPADYEQYFPVAGTYTIDLELTFDNGTKQNVDVPLIVP